MLAVVPDETSRHAVDHSGYQKPNVKGCVLVATSLRAVSGRDASKRSLELAAEMHSQRSGYGSQSGQRVVKTI